MEDPPPPPPLINTLIKILLLTSNIRCSMPIVAACLILPYTTTEFILKAAPLD